MSVKAKYLMLHCTATPEGKDYTAEQVMQWFHARGWRNSGYRKIFHLDGTTEVLREYDHNNIIEASERTNGAKGWNHNTVHYSYIGGVERYDMSKAKDTRTKEQLDSLEASVKEYLYSNPDAKVLGHNQIARKACPSFNVPNWLRSIGIPERNIYSNDMVVPTSICSTEEGYGYIDDLSPFDFEHPQLFIN